MTPEGKVKYDVYRTLANLEASGTVIWFERLQSGQLHNGKTHIYQCRKGTHDFIAVFVSPKKTLCISFIEVKRNDTKAVLSDSQKLFKERYSGKHGDLFFWLVQSGREVSALITKHAYDRLDDVEFNP